VADDAVALRKQLHRAAELSGMEERTAALILHVLEQLGADEVFSGLGGHGLAALYESGSAGPRLLIRCDLDALPIDEGTERDDASRTPGVSHACGHDGHMAIVTEVARTLSARRPETGSVVLLYQPAEETGTGARSVLDDPRFAKLTPDMAFALHNIPGRPLGEVITRAGVFASTARSLWVELTGSTSHAAEPERGVSPAPALAEILNVLPGIPAAMPEDGTPALVTVVHAKLGEEALGTTPGHARVVATLRAGSPDVMTRLSLACREAAAGIAAAHGLRVSMRWSDEFPCVVNDAAAAEIVERAASAAGVNFRQLDAPFRWTEDFGYFTELCPSAMFGLGAGVGAAPLHHPDYRFPDELIPIGARVFLAVIGHVLNVAGSS